MNARQTMVQFSGVTLVALAISAASMGCSDSNNPTPTPTSDSGLPDSTVPVEGGSAPDSGGGNEATTGDDGGGSGDDGGGDGGTTTADSGCVPDGGTGAACNSCATLVSDPYNACSSFTTNCIHFDNTRVPSHPTVP